MDPAPYCVQPDFPLSRIYPLFIGQEPVAAVCVTNREHKLVGVLTRKHLIKHAHHHH